MALFTMIFGLVMGAIVFCLDFEPISGSKLISEGLGTPFLMQAWWLFVLSTIFYMVMSYMSEPRPLTEIRNLIFTREHLKGFQARITSMKDPRIWAGLLLLIMIILYSYFG